MKGIFIAIEGIDKAGKSTQSGKVLNWIASLGYQVRLSSEPNDDEWNGNPLGRTIRRMLEGKMEKPDNPFEFQRLYVLERGLDVFCFIRPFLERGPDHIYIIVRYAHSTINYGMLSGEPPEKFIQLHEDVIGPNMIWPDITIFIDISSEEAIRRLKVNGDQPQFFEKRERLEKVRQNYLKLAEHPKFKDSVVVVNGEKSEENVFEDIKKAIRPKLIPLPE